MRNPMGKISTRKTIRSVIRVTGVTVLSNDRHKVTEGGCHLSRIVRKAEAVCLAWAMIGVLAQDNNTDVFRPHRKSRKIFGWFRVDGVSLQ